MDTAYLQTGYTTYTVTTTVSPTPLSRPQETDQDGFQITEPSSPAPTIRAGDTPVDQSRNLAQSSLTSTSIIIKSSVYFPTGHTASPVTTLQESTESVTDHSNLPLDVETMGASMVNPIDPTPPPGSLPKAGGIVSEDKPTITIIDQTKFWGPMETTIELRSTDLEGEVTAQHVKTTLPGGTSVYQATKTLSSEQGVTVIRQTEAWPSTKIILYQTTTDSKGYILIETITRDVPAKTSVLDSTVTVRPGETLVAIPKMITTIRGGLTQVLQTTYVDSEGNTNISSYTTVVGAESVLASRTYFLATSLPSGYTVITVPTAIPTTEGGTVEVVQAIYTNPQGDLTTSVYTRTLDGTPTTKTTPVVLATPVSPGDRLMTLSRAPLSYPQR